MKIKFKMYLSLFILFALQIRAQQVINSAGNDHQLGNSGVYITDNVGEPFIETFGPAANIMISQGYLQPVVIKKIIPDIKPTYSLTAFINHLPCKDKFTESFIKLELASSATNFTPNFIWSPNVSCQNGNCATIDSLQPGNYNVQIQLQSFDRKGAVRLDTTINMSYEIRNNDLDCQITIFHGVTPNNDGKNEIWEIEDIDKYPKNEVTIYNRWGFEVFKTKNYDNKFNYWPNKDEVTKLPSSTYFYIIDLGDGSKLRKGWVELIKD